MEVSARAARRLAGLLLALLAAGCAEQPASGRTSLHDFQLTGAGADEKDAFCADFALTVAQVQRYFARAEVIDSAALHDKFDYLPCWVRGSAIDGDTAVMWEIRAGGTASTRTPDGHTVLYGCRKCAAEFK